jgi:radical SAM-linked protein
MKIRIRFEKWGELKFIGHLDIMRYFQKVMRRAEVDICYSGGYSPHQIMSFAQPLGLGITSEGEYMDIEVASTLDSETMIKKINSQNVPGIIVTGYRRLPDDAKPGMAILAAADYRIEFKDELLSAADPKKIWEPFYAMDCIMIKKETKSGISEIDIRPRIYYGEAYEKGLKVRLSCCSMDNLRPDTLMDALFDHSGLSLPRFSYTIHRKEMYSRNAEGEFITLLDMGEEIGSD